MNARSNARAVVYLRRSMEGLDAGLSMQLKSITEEAAKLGLTLDASTADLEYMRRHGLRAHKGIFLDEGVPGGDSNRPALRRLIEAVLDEPSLLHVLASARDRIARCKQQLDRIERELRSAGVTLILGDETGAPPDRN